jgi:saccharopine dehydrogenase-like NADP-dependent oxidoreductase
MRKILIIGAGKSASFLVRYFLDKSISEKLDITIGDLDLSNAEKWIINNPNAHTLKLNIFEEEARKKAMILWCQCCLLDFI